MGDTNRYKNTDKNDKTHWKVIVRGPYQIIVKETTLPINN